MPVNAYGLYETYGSPYLLRSGNEHTEEGAEADDDVRAVEACNREEECAEYIGIETKTTMHEVLPFHRRDTEEYRSKDYGYYKPEEEPLLVVLVQEPSLRNGW